MYWFPEAEDLVTNLTYFSFFMFMQRYGWDHKERGDCHVPTLTEVNENLPLSEWKQSWDYEKKLLKQKGSY